MSNIEERARQIMMAAMGGEITAPFVPQICIDNLKSFLLTEGIPFNLDRGDIKHVISERLEREATEDEVDQFVDEHYADEWSSLADEWRDHLDQMVQEEFEPEEEEEDDDEGD